MRENESSPSERPVLVGGTGRSGSTIVGHLLDRHPDLALTRPMEVRFLAGRFGLADALHAHLTASPESEAAARLAVQRILDRWYLRAPDVGLHTSIDRDDLVGLLDAYLGAMIERASDPLMATRSLARSIMARVAGSTVRWVDTTPANARQADRMLLIYPQARVVSVVRDGRDVAASFVSQTFGPDDVFAALRQWERRMLRIHEAMKASPQGTVLLIELMDLVREDRDGSLERLCTFLGIDVDPAMRAWFDAHVSMSSAHPGRWRAQFDEATVRKIDRVYAECTSRLHSAGVPIPGE